MKIINLGFLLITFCFSHQIDVGKLELNEEHCLVNDDKDVMLQESNAIDHITLSKHRMPDGFSWVLNCNSKANGIIGVTYGQRVGLTDDETTVSVSIKPGQQMDLGRGKNGAGPQRKVRIISAWWE